MKMCIIDNVICFDNLYDVSTKELASTGLAGDIFRVKIDNFLLIVKRTLSCKWWNMFVVLQYALG